MANEDLKAKMREALERKQSDEHGVQQEGPVREKAHGPEVSGGRPRRSTGAKPVAEAPDHLSADHGSGPPTVINPTHPPPGGALRAGWTR